MKRMFLLCHFACCFALLMLLCPARAASKIAAGDLFSLWIQPGGTVKAWGRVPIGQSGESAPRTPVPTPIAGLGGVSSVAAGRAFALFCKSDGSVWAMGANGFGQLGDGTTQNRAVPTRVAGLEDVTEVACGAAFSVALTKNGEVWAWGQNSSGQLGNGTTRDALNPVRVREVRAATQIAAGARHALSIGEGGTVWAKTETGRLATELWKIARFRFAFRRCAMWFQLRAAGVIRRAPIKPGRCGVGCKRHRSKRAGRRKRCFVSAADSGHRRRDCGVGGPLAHARAFAKRRGAGVGQWRSGTARRWQRAKPPRRRQSRRVIGFDCSCGGRMALVCAR